MKSTELVSLSLDLRMCLPAPPPVTYYKGFKHHLEILVSDAKMAVITY